MSGKAIFDSYTVDGVGTTHCVFLDSEEALDDFSRKVGATKSVSPKYIPEIIGRWCVYYLREFNGEIWFNIFPVEEIANRQKAVIKIAQSEINAIEQMKRRHR